MGTDIKLSAKADESRYKGRILLKEQPHFLEHASKPGQTGVIGLPDPVPLEAVQIFDNVIWCGRTDVGALAVKTSEGLVLIDSMFPESAVGEFIYPALEKFGWHEEKILAVLITHGHYDHFEGAIALKRDTGCRLYLSEEDTAILPEPDPRGVVHPYPEKIDEFLRDGDAVIYGDTAFLPVVTRGHSPEGMSLIFPVYDKGEKHLAYVLGGGNALRNVSAGSRYIETVYRLWDICTEMGVDVCLSAHAQAMEHEKLAPLLAKRAEGEINPYIIGSDGVSAVLYGKVIDTLERLADFANGMID